MMSLSPRIVGGGIDVGGCAIERIALPQAINDGGRFRQRETTRCAQERRASQMAVALCDLCAPLYSIFDAR